MMQDADHTRRPRKRAASVRPMAGERGSTLAEYALVATIFALAMLGTLHLITNETGTNITRTSNSLTNQSYTP